MLLCRLAYLVNVRSERLLLGHQERKGVKVIVEVQDKMELEASQEIQDILGLMEWTVLLEAKEKEVLSMVVLELFIATK